MSAGGNAHGSELVRWWLRSAQETREDGATLSRSDFTSGDWLGSRRPYPPGERAEAAQLLLDTVSVSGD